jgi:hypothetical protein
MNTLMGRSGSYFIGDTTFKNEKTQFWLRYTVFHLSHPLVYQHLVPRTYLRFPQRHFQAQCLLHILLCPLVQCRRQCLLQRHHQCPAPCQAQLQQPCPLTLVIVQQKLHLRAPLFLLAMFVLVFTFLQVVVHSAACISLAIRIMTVTAGSITILKPSCFGLILLRIRNTG